ncbi:MAG: UDP-N-acetylmuramoyl-L-alanyl-D-glutamate--2,6-diaminopimelate ligase [Thermoanaerobaculia bacterium]|nr:UDP-N-acetylmuramoyl-L-alanyl-D-glutamate--2,6-diaminopimelate ligase [Thermoanaerobaculia bacterium]
MILSELISRLEPIGIAGSDAVEIRSVQSDSRRVKEGALFVAIPGFETDGALFIDQAIERGAIAIVTEREIEEREGVTFVRVADARRALALVASTFYGRPATKLDLIGVTGTSGKTTTTKMIESILDQTDDPVGLIGTIEYRAGETREVADRTTPDAAVLQEWFAKMVEAGVRRGVMEVSSHALALHRTADVEFAAAVFTNLSRDHFDFHDDFDDYFEAKKILFDQIDRSKKRAVVNRDDEWGLKLIDELGEAVVTFGMEEADIRPADDFRTDIEGLHGKVETPWGNVSVESSLLGTPNLYNWLGAIGASLVVGVSIPEIEAGIRALRTVEGRFEKVGDSIAPAVIVDYAHKPDALEKLLHAVRHMSPNREIVLVFGCGGNRDEGKRPLMGAVAARLGDRTILTSDNPRREEPEAILDQIEEGYREVRSEGYERIVSRRQAIRKAILGSGENDVVIIAGKGHETYQVIGDSIEHFDDREEAMAAIREKKDS